MTLKSLEELNREFMEKAHLGESSNASESKTQEPTLKEPALPKPALQEVLKAVKIKGSKLIPGKPKNKSAKRKHDKTLIISDVLFYLAVLIIILSALIYKGNGETPKTMMGYSYFTVLTSSMQDEIPKGSLILVKQINPQDFKVGDNMTYMRDRKTSVTHKIINIYDNYENSGGRGFHTKGVNNLYPDKDIVYESNVVGKVIWSIPVIGAILAFVGANIYIIFVLFGLCIFISLYIRKKYGNSEDTVLSKLSEWQKTITKNPRL